MSDQHATREIQEILSFSMQIKAARFASACLPSHRFESGELALSATDYLAKAEPALNQERARLLELYTTTGELSIRILAFKPKEPLPCLRGALRGLAYTLEDEVEAVGQDADTIADNYEALEGAADHIEAIWGQPKPYFMRRMPFMGDGVIVARDDDEANRLVAFMNKCVDTVEEVSHTLDKLPIDQAHAHVKALKRRSRGK